LAFASIDHTRTKTRKRLGKKGVDGRRRRKSETTGYDEGGLRTLWVDRR
jgi:hypothetical protein